jgi:signal transduction histidine kinase
MHRRDDYTFSRPLIIDDPHTADYLSGLMRGLTHKYNNIVAVIKGFADLAMMADSLAEAERENLEHVREAAQSAARLNDRIIAATGRARITDQALDLGAYLRLVEGQLRSVFRGQEVNFELVIPPDLPPVRADPTRLKEIIQELLSNAAEASVGGGAILEIVGPGVASPAEDNRVDLFVRNEGPTIAADRLPGIFRPFQSGKGRGHHGLGLAIAAALAGQMGMELAVKSREGKTSFWLSCLVA